MINGWHKGVMAGIDYEISLLYYRISYGWKWQSKSWKRFCAHTSVIAVPCHTPSWHEAWHSLMAARTICRRRDIHARTNTYSKKTKTLSTRWLTLSNYEYCICYDDKASALYIACTTMPGYHTIGWLYLWRSLYINVPQCKCIVTSWLLL